MPVDAHADIPSPLDIVALAALIDGTTAGVGVLDTRLRYLYVNPALERLNGVPAVAHLGRTVSEVLPEVDAREDLMRAVLADGRAREITSSGRTPAASGTATRYWHGAYHRLEVSGRVVGIAGIVLEVMASDEDQRLLAQAQRHLNLLDAASTRIGTTLDMDTTCAELVDLVVPGLADYATVEVFPRDVAPPVRPAPPGWSGCGGPQSRRCRGCANGWPRSAGPATTSTTRRPRPYRAAWPPTSPSSRTSPTTSSSAAPRPRPNGSPPTGPSACTPPSSCRSPCAASRSASSAWYAPATRPSSRTRTW